jgi:hypothetical protein
VNSLFRTVAENRHKVIELLDSDKREPEVRFYIILIYFSELIKYLQERKMCYRRHGVRVKGERADPSNTKNAVVTLKSLKDHESYVSTFKFAFFKAVIRNANAHLSLPCHSTAHQVKTTSSQKCMHKLSEDMQEM